MSVVIVDYGMSNLGSIARALEECGASVEIAEEPSRLKTASRIVVPGVGAFADGMAYLNRRGWSDALREAAGDGVPILGICLGMQLLADHGEEGGGVAGLGLIPGVVRRLVPDTPATRIPHVGWNEVHQVAAAPLFKGVDDRCDFYFVHSFHFVPEKQEHVLARTPYCEGFVSVVAREQVIGVQFHPEKSGRPGFQLIGNFLRL